MEISFSHRPVMLDECIDALRIRPDGVYADCTAGGGGHSFAIASRLGEGGRLYAFDRDSEAIAAAGARLAPFGERVTMVHSNFVYAAEYLRADGVDGVLIDLGVSSHQLDTAERGFSYMQDAPLDMRMDQGEGMSAFEVVNGYSESDLIRIIRDYGEERFAPRIASAIVRARETAPVRTTLELSELIKGAIPAKFREGGHHPAKKTFQAIRIEVNGELKVIEPTLRSLVECLRPGGRIAVITFHSLEDRIVKQTFADLAKGCTCPPDFPVCVCGKKPVVTLPERKPVVPSAQELEENPRSRSAKLRVAQKI